MTVSQLEMAHVVRASLQVPGMPVLTSNQCYLLAQELNKNLEPAQQGQGEPLAFEIEVSGYTTLLARTHNKADATAAHYRALGHTVDIRPLGPLADPAEVERLRANAAQHKLAMDAACGELAEAQALLRRVIESCCLSFEQDAPENLESLEADIIAALSDGPGSSPPTEPLSEEDVQWIVNSLAELGVIVKGQAFFLYKGRSLQYAETVNSDDGSSIYYRPVFKREFGECAHPINHKDPRRIGTVSLDDSDEWRLLPSALSASAEPSAPVEIDERAAYDAWRHSDSGYVRHFDRHEWAAWQARAALERKP